MTNETNHNVNDYKKYINKAAEISKKFGEQLVNEVVDTVEFLKCCYEIKYHSIPQFVKLPYWIHERLIEENRLNGFDEEKITLCGLTVCPTASITDISQIEVF